MLFCRLHQMHFRKFGILRMVLLLMYAGDPERCIDASLSEDKKIAQ